MKENNEDNIFYARRIKIIRQIKGEAALFCSAPTKMRTRDLEYEYHQEANFYYLTGLNTETKAALLLLGSIKGPRSILFIQDRSAASERWSGERLGIARARKCIKVDEVKDYKDLETTIATALHNCSTLHYAPGLNTDIDDFIFTLFKSSVGPRTTFPNIISDSRIITSELRWVKDKNEINNIRHAANITTKAFFEFALKLREFHNEKHAAKNLEMLFFNHGATETAFPTIVAAGKNATVLHHQPNNTPLWKKELVLADAGASFNSYCSDVTRTFPVSGKFSTPQAEIYVIVYKAWQSAIAKAKPNVSINSLHKAAVKEIIRGLISLKILHGTVQDNLRKETYKKFFMHRIGHWLGLETHDISPIYSAHNPILSYSRPMVAGNVITIEPGLYFDAKDTSVPKEYRGIGIRIEDDVLITPKGSEVLTKGIPTSRTDIEELLR